KYQIVSPRDVGIDATGINGRGDSKPGGRPTVQQTAGSGDPRRTASVQHPGHRPAAYLQPC
ncbi:MAG: hypothetical protein WBX00_05365, partial [Isosphaeraceae bacterium]